MRVLSGAEGRSDYCPSCLTSLGRKQMGSWRDELSGPNPHPGTQPSLCCVAVGLESTTDMMNHWLDNNMKHNLPNLLDGFSVPVQLFPVNWFFYTRQNLCLQLIFFYFGKFRHMVFTTPTSYKERMFLYFDVRWKFVLLLNDTKT